MKRLLSWLGVVFAAAWGLIAFMANQSADDTKKNIASYADTPIIRSLPGWFYGVASSTWFLAVTFFLLGGLSALLLVRWSNRDSGPSPVRALGNDVALAGFALDNMSAVYNNPAVIANMNLVLNKMRRAGITTPPPTQGFSRDKMSYYLLQVSAYLKDEDMESAKASAASIVKDWGAH